MCIYLQKVNDICADYFQKVHVKSPLHGQTIAQIQTKRSGVGVEPVWSTPTPTPARCHDSGRLRLRLRLRTLGSKLGVSLFREHPLRFLAKTFNELHILDCIMYCMY